MFLKLLFIASAIVISAIGSRGIAEPIADLAPLESNVDSNNQPLTENDCFEALSTLFEQKIALDESNINCSDNCSHHCWQLSNFFKISQLSDDQSPSDSSTETDSESDEDVQENPEVDEVDLEIELYIRKAPTFPGGSTPVYTIDEQEIQDKGADNLAEILRGLPGFAINDYGYGADIHTGTYYRGASINQSIFLLNGRPIGSNISTYHGTTDLNSILSGDIEKVELSSGTSTTLYGSEAFGGIVNIVTKKGEGPPKFVGGLQLGSYDQNNVQGSFGGATDLFSYSFNYERFKAQNDYVVPPGAANRGPDRRLFNGDSFAVNYSGNLTFDLNSRNTLSFDATKTASRRGLLYFGFPLQRDRLNHELLNIGLSWKTLLGEGEDSILKATFSYNQDYFDTFGPTQRVFFRNGTLDSRFFNARLEHDWQLTLSNNLRWGIDLQNPLLTGEIDSNFPQLARLNGIQDRERFHTALFALNTWKITDTFQAEFGLRQNFNSQFDSYLNPSVGTRWEVAPFIALRGSWVSLQRNPGLDQLYFFDTVHNWLPNPDLEPEKGSSWTAGLDVVFTPSLTGQFTYFGSSLDDRLGIRAGRWENIGLVNTHGLEVALNWKIAPQWRTFLNYTYTSSTIESGPERGLQFALIPFSVAQMGIGYTHNDWRVNLFANYYSGARRAFFTNPGDTNTDFSPPWINLDLSLQIPIVERIRLTLFLENLADRRHEKSNRIYQPGLTFRLGIQSFF